MAANKKSPRTRKPRTQAASSDLLRLKRFFADIDGPACVALQPVSSRNTQSDGHDDAAGALHERALPKETSYVFWHQQSHERAFNKGGEMKGDLLLHWGGDHDVVKKALTSLPPPFELKDGGPQQAFAIHKPSSGDLNDESAVLRKLASERSAEKPDLAWLQSVVRQGPRSTVLRAAMILMDRWAGYYGGDPPNTQALEALALSLAGDLESLAGSPSPAEESTFADGLTRLLLLLRSADPAHYATLRDQFRTHKKSFFRGVAATVLGREAGPQAEQWLRDMLLDARNKTRIGAARTPYVRPYSLLPAYAECLATNRGQPEKQVHLDLAQDPALPGHIHTHYVDRVCSDRGHRERGALDVAADTSLPRSLREEALARACDFLQFAWPPDTGLEGKKEALALHAAGLSLDEKWLSS